MVNNFGYEVGESCNRDGCAGIIREHDTDISCTCFQNAPCSKCTDSRAFCEECGWDGVEDNKQETIFSKEKRLKNRKQSYKMSYKKGIYYSQNQYANLIDYLNQPDVLVRVLNTGEMDDGTGFITITIEGLTPKEGGI